MQFSYRLHGAGWASAYLRSEDFVAELIATWETDALADFLDALLAILGGELTAEARWEHEPGFCYWRFTRSGEALNVRVSLTGEAVREFDVDEDDEIDIFVADTFVWQFAEEVADDIGRLYERVGMDGYHRLWEQTPFPLSRLRHLQQLVAGQHRMHRNDQRFMEHLTISADEVIETATDGSEELLVTLDYCVRQGEATVTLRTSFERLREFRADLSGVIDSHAEPARLRSSDKATEVRIGEHPIERGLLFSVTQRTGSPEVESRFSLEGGDHSHLVHLRNQLAEVLRTFR